MNKKHKKVCEVLNSTEHILISTSTITGCPSISAFAPLINSHIRITSSAIRLKIYVITAAIKKYKSIIKKKKKKHEKIVLLVKTKKALMNSNISHDEFVINNVLKEYDDIKE